MNHITVLLIKFVSCMIAFAIGLDFFFDATIVDIFSFSLFITIASYMLGDLIVLPRAGNTAAIMVDFLFTYMSVWVFGSVLLDNYMQIAWGSILSAIVVTVAEIFVHRYLHGRISTEQTRERKGVNFHRSLVYGTEFAEEQNVTDAKKRK
ncbi:YndM family protein [Bacillus sp. CGMCC 1.60114]|uniref:YndM family protein n=1 Tax=unclassified Bacillus (in: firmicutes) TaxID=185979 RepID=UPI00362B7AAA